jgi:hypothetical protein
MQRQNPTHLGMSTVLVGSRPTEPDLEITGMTRYLLFRICEDPVTCASFSTPPQAFMEEIGREFTTAMQANICQQIMSPFLNNSPCRPSRPFPFLLLHVIGGVRVLWGNVRQDRLTALLLNRASSVERGLPPPSCTRTRFERTCATI